MRSNLGIQSTKDYWQIPEVEYKGETSIYDLAKTLLDNGNAKTQDKWAEHRKIAEPKGYFYLADMPLYHAIFTAAFKQPNSNQKEEIRRFIQEQIRSKYPITLTRIQYTPKGKDKIIHNFGTNEQYDLEEYIAGPDRKIESEDRNALNALLGTDNINEINEVYNWINNKPIYIWRVNEKPEQIEERVAGFIANSDRFNLNCSGSPQGSYEGLGVRRAKILNESLSQIAIKEGITSPIELQKALKFYKHNKKYIK